MIEKSKQKKLLIKVLNGDKHDQIPIWLMRQAGRHLPEYKKLRLESENFLDFCYSPKLSIEATIQPIRRYNLDAAILFSDILVIPDALGQQVEFVPGKGPVLKPITNVSSIKKLNQRKVLQYLSPIYQAIEEIIDQLKMFSFNPSLIGFAGAPWTVATYMVEGGSSKDYHTTRKWAYESPHEFSQLIDLLVDVTSQHLIQQIDSGVEVIQIFDSWAGVLPPSQFNRWVITPTIEIVKRVKLKFPKVPIIGFPRGAGLLYKSFADCTGVDAVSLDASVPLTWAVENLPKDIVIQGNLDNLALLIGGSLMENEIFNILTAFSDRPFIFNLGHGVLPDTPIPHVEQLIKLVRGASHD
jgi:uroporphyrinogen decarboxylase